MGNTREGRLGGTNELCMLTENQILVKFGHEHAQTKGGKTNMDTNMNKTKKPNRKMPERCWETKKQ